MEHLQLPAEVNAKLDAIIASGEAPTPEIWNGTNRCTLKSTHVLEGFLWGDEDECDTCGVTYLGEAQTWRNNEAHDEYVIEYINEQDEEGWDESCQSYLIRTCDDPNGYESLDKSTCSGPVYWVDNQGTYVCEYHGQNPIEGMYHYRIRELTPDEQAVADSTYPQ